MGRKFTINIISYNTRNFISIVMNIIGIRVSLLLRLYMLYMCIESHKNCFD